MGSLESLSRPRVGETLNVSRRAALAAGGGLLLALGLPAPQRRALAQAAPALPPASPKMANVGAFLRIAPDGTFHLASPFVEGGQGIDTAIAQLVAEELDADPAKFVVTCAPADAAYQIMFGDQMRITGGSLSVRSTYTSFRQLGANARAMLIETAAARLNVPAAQLATEPGMVVHAASNRRIAYGALAEDAAKLPVPANVTLKDRANFRLIGKPVTRLDARAKSTGAVKYGIDLRVENMLFGFVLHGPRQGGTPSAIGNEAALRSMPGVHSVHLLDQGVAVLADTWWRARKAAEAAEITWQGGVAENVSSETVLASLRAASRAGGVAAETHGDAPAALSRAAKVIEAEYDAPYLAHAQLEPPSALARFNADGTLDLWVPNQAPEFYQQAAAGVAGLPPAQVRVHSPPLGGFFGRHFLYGTADVYGEAITLAKAAGRPVKVVWSREEEFKRDAYRPLSHVRFRAALGADGMPAALHAVATGEGPLGKHLPSFLRNPAIDDSVVEGITGKHYAISVRRVEYAKVPHPVNVGFWRSVGHSMNDFFYESFLDELAQEAGKDPYEYRLALLAGSPRHATLLRAVAELSGGWKRGPFTEGGLRRARGVAMASPFGSETATIAEVSAERGEVRVHDIWIAIDCGTAVNPGLIAAQLRSAAAIGLSTTLLEEMVIEAGAPRAVNYDAYSILPPDRMPRIHTRVIESGAPIGGVGEPGTPGVPPAVANAVAALTGQRIRSLPMAKTRIGSV